MARVIFVCVLFMLSAVRTSAQCNNCLSQNPAAIQSATSSAFTLISPCMQGGEYALCNVTAGETYEFQTCATSSYDTQITIFDDATGCSGPALAYNDDWCGLSSWLSWTASFTGVARVLVSQYWCTTNASCATLEWRCVTCNLPPFCYTPSAIAYNWVTCPAPNYLSLWDDQVTGALPIGFTFCFAGSSYTQFYLCSNGWIGFSSGQTGTWMPSPIPNSGAPRNCIMAAWCDWYPPAGGQVYYQTIGTSPNRQLVVSWDNIGMYVCNSTLGRYHIVLSETSNTIDINIAVKPVCLSWSGGINATEGIHDALGLSAATVPGRNGTSWTATNDSYRFTPTCGTCAPVVLPVELTNFYGEANSGYNLLHWSTASEINSRLFTVERGQDGTNWTSIGTLPGAGTTTQPHQYVVRDDLPPAGLNYYRLKQADFNGDMHYSGIVALTTPGAHGVKIFPNPASSTLNIVSGDAAISSVQLTDVTGRVVYSAREAGVSSMTIDISAFPAGVYMVEVKQENTITKEKLVKAQ